MADNLEEFLQKNHYNENEVIVLEKNENTELIEQAKPCTQEFFNQLFSPTGEFWTLYNQVGLAFRPPEKTQHVIFLESEAFFCKNFEQEYLKTFGPKKTFQLREGKLTQKIKPTLENALLVLATPFDWLTLTTATALAPLKLNEYFSEFPKIQKEAINEYEKNKTLEPITLAKKSLENARKTMTYSFAASLAYSLKVIPTKQMKEMPCEQDNYAKLCQTPEKLAQDFPFYSQTPYDISKPRFSEELPQPSEQPTIQNEFMRLRENAKFACARYLALERQAYLEIGKHSGLGEDVFYLQTPELEKALENPNHALEIIKERKNKQKSTLPRTIACYQKQIITFNDDSTKIIGIPAGAQTTTTGIAIEVNSQEDYSKNFDGKIILTKTLPPNIVSLYSKAAGIVSAGGGVLSHASIVAREKNLPCITATKNFKKLKEGQTITINGKTGEVKIEKQ